MSFPNATVVRLGTVNNCVVATTSTAVASSAFGTQTYAIRVAATAACFVKVDAAPTAAATDALIPANTVHIIKVNPGQKISAFSATTQTVSVVEVTG